jgi:serine/threonine-protein kinase RsbW/stage II sporulation protein AB (anti-sigma F factor)
MLDQRWPADRDAVGAIRRAVGEVAGAAGATERAAQSVALAVSEAATNVVLHAYVHGSGSREIHVVAFSEEGRLHVVVTDDGRGMVPRRDSPGLGLGLPLIAQLADDVRIGTEAGAGTQITMAFRLDT